MKHNTGSLWSFFLFFCFVINYALLHGEQEFDQENVIRATIFVHGIVSIKPFLTIPNIAKFTRDKIANTYYARSVELIRRDPYFFQQQPMQGLGLQKIDLSLSQPGASSTAFARLFEYVGKLAGNCTNHIYYTFGWSGLLSPRMRYLEATIFYDHLFKEFGPYLAKNIPVKLRIVCYSHGGNVALKLAELFEQEQNSMYQKLRIDELILLGVPVLPETEHLVNSILFNNIYHFYSYGDRVQRMDCFSLNRMFSKRIFRPRSDYKIPDKLIQINIAIKRPCHEQCCLPTTYQEKVHGVLRKRTILRTADPGHTELWSFGWIPSSYRKMFPLYPLPFAVFTPYVIEHVKKCTPQSRKLMVEVHPTYESMLLYDCPHKEMTVCPFLKREQLMFVQQWALHYEPINFDKKTYNHRLNLAKVQARKEWLNERNIHRFGFHTMQSNNLMPQCQ